MPDHGRRIDVEEVVEQDAIGYQMRVGAARHVAALRRLVANGTELRPFSREVLDACYNATQEFYAETAAKNEKFKKVYAQWKKFLDDEHQWFRVEEQQFDNYMLSKKAT